MFRHWFLRDHLTSFLLVMFYDSFVCTFLCGTVLMLPSTPVLGIAFEVIHGNHFFPDRVQPTIKRMSSMATFPQRKVTTVFRGNNCFSTHHFLFRT